MLQLKLVVFKISFFSGCWSQWSTYTRHSKSVRMKDGARSLQSAVVLTNLQFVITFHYQLVKQTNAITDMSHLQ